MQRERINCYKCRHFYITWDRAYPNGCKYFEFKTKQFPSAEVFRLSKMPCFYFEEKIVRKRIDYTV